MNQSSLDFGEKIGVASGKMKQPSCTLSDAFLETLDVGRLKVSTGCQQLTSVCASTTAWMDVGMSSSTSGDLF